MYQLIMFEHLTVYSSIYRTTLLVIQYTLYVPSIIVIKGCILEYMPIATK